MFIGLVKPQFESAHDETDHGVVRDEAVRLRTVEEVKDALTAQGFRVTGTAPSPITGPEGNVEYLVRAEFVGGSGDFCGSDEPDGATESTESTGSDGC